MTLATGLIAFLGVLVFSATSFFFALAETALFSLGKIRIRRLSAEAPNQGSLVERLMEQSSDTLATLVLGNTLANSLIVVLGLEWVLHGEWPALAVIPALLAWILIGCEVIPKTLAVRAPEKWALRTASSLRFFQWLTTPLRRVAQKSNEWIASWILPSSWKPKHAVSDDEFQELLDLAFHQGTLTRSEKEMIVKIISLDRRTARDVMKPRAQMHAIPDDLSVEEMIEAARRSRQRRVPMYDETPDTIVGILNTRTFLLDPYGDLAEAIEFPSFVPESMNLLQLMKSFQKQQRGLAIVLDEFGGTAGVVTFEDLLEHIVGEIRESTAAAPHLERIESGKWKAPGTYRIDDFRREYPSLGDVPNVDTLGGLMVQLLEVVPAGGQSAQFRGLRFTAQQVDERRVKELIVEVIRKK